MEYLLTGENPVSTACGPSHPVPEWLSLPWARASHAPQTPVAEVGVSKGLEQCSADFRHIGEHFRAELGTRWHQCLWVMAMGHSHTRLGAPHVAPSPPAPRPSGYPGSCAAAGRRGCWGVSNVQWRSLQETSILAVNYCSKVVCSLRASLHPVPGTAPRRRGSGAAQVTQHQNRASPAVWGLHGLRGCPTAVGCCFLPVAQEGCPVLLLSASRAGSNPANTVGAHAQEGLPRLQQPPTQAGAQPARGQGRPQPSGPRVRVPLPHPAGHPLAGGCAGTQPPGLSFLWVI